MLTYSTAYWSRTFVTGGLLSQLYTDCFLVLFIFIFYLLVDNQATNHDWSWIYSHTVIICMKKMYLWSFHVFTGLSLVLSQTPGTLWMTQQWYIGKTWYQHVSSSQFSELSLNSLKPNSTSAWKTSYLRTFLPWLFFLFYIKLNLTGKSKPIKKDVSQKYMCMLIWNTLKTIFTVGRIEDPSTPHVVNL